jgi:hypothetical protein
MKELLWTDFTNPKFDLAPVLAIHHTAEYVTDLLELTLNAVRKIGFPLSKELVERGIAQGTI